MKLLNRSLSVCLAVLMVVSALCLVGGEQAAASDRPILADFARDGVRDHVALNGRYSHSRSQGNVRLRGSGAAFLKQSTGPGVYHVRFMMHEPERFQYHQTRIGLFVADAEQPGGDGFYLAWHTAGILTFYKVVDGERTTVNQFIRGGRDNPNRYEADQYVDITLHVPEAGDGVYVYCWQTDTEGEPTTGFRLPEELPRQGHFGVHNSKWYSHALIRRMHYFPNTD